MRLNYEARADEALVALMSCEETSVEPTMLTLAYTSIDVAR